MQLWRWAAAWAAVWAWAAVAGSTAARAEQAPPIALALGSQFLSHLAVAGLHNLAWLDGRTFRIRGGKLVVYIECLRVETDGAALQTTREGKLRIQLPMLRGSVAFSGSALARTAAVVAQGFVPQGRSLHAHALGGRGVRLDFLDGIGLTADVAIQPSPDQDGVALRVDHLELTNVAQRGLDQYRLDALTMLAHRILNRFLFEGWLNHKFGVWWNLLAQQLAVPDDDATDSVTPPPPALGPLWAATAGKFLLLGSRAAALPGEAPPPAPEAPAALFAGANGANMLLRTSAAAVRLDQPFLDNLVARLLHQLHSLDGQTFTMWLSRTTKTLRVNRVRIAPSDARLIARQGGLLELTVRNAEIDIQPEVNWAAPMLRGAAGTVMRRFAQFVSREADRIDIRLRHRSLTALIRLSSADEAPEPATVVLSPSGLRLCPGASGRQVPGLGLRFAVERLDLGPSLTLLGPQNGEYPVPEQDAGVINRVVARAAGQLIGVGMRMLEQNLAGKVHYLEHMLNSKVLRPPAQLGGRLVLERPRVVVSDSDALILSFGGFCIDPAHAYHGRGGVQVEDLGYRRVSKPRARLVDSVSLWQKVCDWLYGWFYPRS